MAFLEELIGWVGKFHPATVHFPIALLVAAAVAELLLLLTGRSKFEAVSQFCIWFGAATAPVAGMLGWCLAGFHLIDRNWVLTTHRWLGTSTAAWAVLLLVLSEVSRRPGRRPTRRWFQIALFLGAGMVLLTGFFGGAVLYGLDHYAWPE
jgi:uncharacterized membrane protein